MSQELRANTAVDVLIGPHVDSTDGNTTEEGLTIEDEHVLLSKLGQGLAAKNDANDALHDDEGYYNCPLNATDTNTEGTLVLITHLAGALPVRHEYMVLAEAAWDSKYIAKDDGFMDVNIKTVGRADTQETEANNLESACSNYSVTRGLTGTAVPGAAADAAGGLPISDAGNLDLDTQLATTDQIGAAGVGLTEAGADGDHLTAINLPNQTMDIIGNITGNLSGSVGSVTGHTNQTADHTAPIATAQADLDLLTGADGATLASLQGNYAPNIVVPATKAEMDTAHGLLATEAKQDIIDTNVDQIETAVITNAAGVDVAADIITMDALIDAIKVVTDNMADSASTLLSGTVSWDNTNATTTVFYSDDITEATADHFKGRIVIFLTGDLQYQATDITDYELAAGEGKFTVTALTEAPADNVTFVIV